MFQLLRLVIVAVAGSTLVGRAAATDATITDTTPELFFVGGTFTPYEWKILADDLGFTLSDNTAITTPFRIREGAPSYSLFIDAFGQIGMGTAVPQASVHLKKPAEASTAEIMARFEISDDFIGNLEIRNGSSTNGIFHPRLRGTTAAQAVPLTMEGLITTDAGVNPVVAYDAARRSGGAVVTRPLVVYRNNGVSKAAIAANGVVTATSFNPVSSRARKHDIADLDSQEAASALRQLAPVKFIYNDDESNQKRVGFIAEDVPDVVAAPDRQSVPIMDVVALVTRVVKDQQQTIDEQKKSLDEQKSSNERQQETNDQQQKTIDQQGKAIAELMKRLEALEASAGK